ncbi:MAG: hypothetical protein AAFP78_14620, partial [Pseudomonadota bacterium]
RRQDRAMFSAWTHALRIGKSDDFAPPSTFRFNGRFDYATRLRHWAATFGRDSVDAIAFDGIEDVVTDFFRRAALSPPRAPGAPSNKSLDQVRAAFMAELNAQLPRFVDGALNPARADLSEAIDNAPGLGAPATLPARDARAILSLYAASNARLARDWNAGLPFFDGEFTEKGSDAEPVDVDHVIAIAARLWRRKQTEVAHLRARLKAAGAV